MARNDHPAAKGVADRAAAKERSVREYHERVDAMRPTPTQEENDLARVGALNIDEKEPDGGEPEGDAVRRQMASRLPGGSPYDTRDVTASSPGAAAADTDAGKRRR